MHTHTGRRMRLLAPLALALIAGLGALSLRAGDTLSSQLTVTSDAPNSPNVITLTASASKPRVVG